MKIAIAYWSMSQNTENAANYLENLLSNHEVSVFPTGMYDGFDPDAFDAFAFGCPAMGSEVLEENEFDPFFTSIETSLQGKKVALFGSYGWGSGEWMEDWKNRCEGDGADVIGTIIFNGPMDGCEAEFDALAQKF